MRNVFALALIAVLLSTGCAKKAAMEDHAAHDAPPAVIEAAPAVVVEPVPPAVIEEAAPVVQTKTDVAEVQNAAVEPAAMKIFFEFDSSLLTADSKGALVGNALWLQAQPEVRVLIEGHTDERGSSSYNLALGEKRAQAVRDYLLKLGIASERISIVSYGKEKAAAGADETAWAQDRRAEFVKTN